VAERKGRANGLAAAMAVKDAHRVEANGVDPTTRALI